MKSRFFTKLLSKLMKRKVCSRFWHYSNDSLLECFDGLIKRYGEAVLDLSLPYREVKRLVKSSTKITGGTKKNLFWTKQTLKEIQIRVAEGRIQWPPEKYKA